MTIPAHVQAALVAAGKLTTDGLGRAAQIRTCNRCHRSVLIGLDHHRCALRATCDPTALDPVGELVAILAGRSTYDLWGRELNRRTDSHIRGGQRQPVIADHQCAIAVKVTPSVIALFLPPPLMQPEEQCPY